MYLQLGFIREICSYCLISAVTSFLLLFAALWHFQIEATVLAINSADDERNPPETGLITQAMKRVKNGKLYLILASDETSGHLTTGNAKFYKQELQKLLEEAPRRAM